MFPSARKARAIQNLAVLYGWKFDKRFGDEQPHPGSNEPTACLTRGDEIVYIRYADTTANWVKCLSAPVGAHSRKPPMLFLASLWSKDFIGALAAQSILANQIVHPVDCPPASTRPGRIRISKLIGTQK